MPASRLAGRAVLARTAAAALVLAVAAAAPRARAQAAALTPARALELAARQNPSLRAALADASAARQALRAAQAARGPTLFANASGQKAEQLIATAPGVSRTESRRVSGELGVRYTTPIGTQLEAAGGSNVSWRSANITPNSATTVSLGPNPAAELRVSARQPLLRGAGRDGVLSAERVATAQRSEAERTAAEAASALARDVLDAYWELWYAEHAVAVQRAGLEVARAQHRDAQLRAQLGTTAPSEVLRFASELASIGDSLAQARTLQRTRALALGQLLGLSATAAPALDSAAEPPSPPAPAPLPRLLSRARHASSQLSALRASVQAARERLRAAADADQARLDLTTTLSASGLWADDALSGLALPDDRPAFAALLGLELELPLGDSESAAQHAGARAQLQAAQARYQAREQAIDAQVAELREQLTQGRERVELSQQMTRAASQLAEAERKRFALGTTTSLDVVQAQQTDREAELRWLRARVDQAQAALGLRHLLGELLASPDQPQLVASPDQPQLVASPDQAQPPASEADAQAPAPEPPQ